MRVIARCIVVALAVAPAGAQTSAAPPAPPMAAERESAPAPGMARLLLRDGSTREGRMLGLEGDELLLVASTDPATTTRVPLAELVSLVQAPPEAGSGGASGTAVLPPPAARVAPAAADDDGEAPEDDAPAAAAAAVPAAPDLLYLAPPATASATEGLSRTGDRLVGRLLGGDDYGVRFQIADAVPFDVPFESIERLLPHASGAVDRLALLPGAPADDRLWRTGKDGAPDSLAGVVQRVSDTQVTFEGALGTLQFAWSDVLAVVFAPDAEKTAPLPGTHVVVRLRDGSRLDAGLVGWHDERCVLATRFAPKLELPASAVVSLVRRDGPVTLLADLAPSRVEQWPTFGKPADFLFPWRSDLSVSGQLLSVGGIARASGLGVHSNARLTFVAPPGNSAFLVTAGLCDEVTGLPATGSVSFEVRVDGKLVAATGVVREGEPARRLLVTGLHGGESVELLTGDGGDDDAGDRAAWVDGAFVRGHD